MACVPRDGEGPVIAATRHFTLFLEPDTRFLRVCGHDGSGVPALPACVRGARLHAVFGSGAGSTVDTVLVTFDEDRSRSVCFSFGSGGSAVEVADFAVAKAVFARESGAALDDNGRLLIWETKAGDGRAPSSPRIAFPGVTFADVALRDSDQWGCCCELWLIGKSAEPGTLSRYSFDRVFEGRSNGQDDFAVFRHLREALSAIAVGGTRILALTAPCGNLVRLDNHRHHHLFPLETTIATTPDGKVKCAERRAIAVTGAGYSLLKASDCHHHHHEGCLTIVETSLVWEQGAGRGAADPAGAKRFLEKASVARQIAAGMFHAVALDATNVIRCCGDDDFSQCSAADGLRAASPQPHHRTNCDGEQLVKSAARAPARRVVEQKS